MCNSFWSLSESLVSLCTFQEKHSYSSEDFHLMGVASLLLSPTSLILRVVTRKAGVIVQMLSLILHFSK